MRFDPMIRQVHRWTCIAFTLLVIVNLALMGRDVVWVGLLTLVPLLLLLLTGLWMFAQPYLAKRRGDPAAG